MRGIILEDRYGNKRIIEPGKQIRPRRRPGEKVVGVEPDPNAVVFYNFRMCSHCGEKGVYDST